MLIISVLCRRIGLIEKDGLSVAYHLPTVLFSVILFIIFLKLHISESNIFSMIGHKYSLHIYIVHWIFIELYQIGIIGCLPIYTRPLVVMILSIVLSVLYEKIKNIVRLIKKIIYISK